jgi:hypothetical protein
MSGTYIIAILSQRGGIKCEVVALCENFVDRPERYDSFSAKSSVFLAHGLGVFFSISIHLYTT